MCGYDFKKLSIIILSFLLFLAVLQPLKTSMAAERKTIRVALCQIFCLDGDRSGNFARIENAIRDAKSAKADIACFPETAILGWVNPDAHVRAYPIPGNDSNRLSQLARQYSIYICVGLAEKEEDLLYDSMILIDDTGNILLKHRKINILSDLMTPAYTPGKNVEVVETKFGTIGLMICADTFKNDLLQQMAALKPDLVLVPYGWAAPEEQWPQHGKQLEDTVIKAAKSIGAPLIGVDLVGEITHGPWQGQVYGGHSVAADANGKILAVANDRDRAVRVISMSLKK